MRYIGVQTKGAAAPPPDSAQPLFFGQKPAAKYEKKLYLLSEKNGIHSV